MTEPLILAVELGARRVRAVLATRAGTVIGYHRCLPGEVKRCLTGWIAAVHERYGTDVVTVGRRCRRWTGSLIHAVAQAGSWVELLEPDTVATALRLERQFRDAIWERQLSLQSVLWSALHESGGVGCSISCVVRGWARDQHRWAVHCLDAEEFDEVCRAGDEVPF
jgi:hypothetical protein